MPAPVKDFTVFSFTLGLSDLDANSVNPQVLDFLSTYEARTLVARDDHPRMAVPLFNIQAAAAGERNKEIAHRLGISSRTVKAHLTSVYNKLGVDSRAAAIAVAAQKGLLS